MRILIIISILLLTVSAYAFDKSPAQAIEWWLTNQGAFKGSQVSTKQNDDGSYSITKWVSSVKQPTDTEVNKIISDYEKQPKAKSLEERISILELKSVIP